MILASPHYIQHNNKTYIDDTHELNNGTDISYPFVCAYVSVRVNVRAYVRVLPELSILFHQHPHGVPLLCRKTTRSVISARKKGHLVG